MNEENVTKYYTAIAQKVDETIPCEWEKAALYTEETEIFKIYTSIGF